MTLASALLLAGCGNSVYDLPEGAPAIETRTYVNEKDTEDTYVAIMYDGREYVFYGTIGRRMHTKEIAACVGYTGGDTNERIFALSDTDDYIMQKYMNGMMEQPGFYRAVDTLGKEIYTPDYIDSLDYELWEDSSAEERSE